MQYMCTIMVEDFVSYIHIIDTTPDELADVELPQAHQIRRLHSTPLLEFKYQFLGASHL